LDADAAQDQRATRDEAMRVVSDAHAHDAPSDPPATRPAALNRSVWAPDPPSLWNEGPTRPVLPGGPRSGWQSRRGPPDRSSPGCPGVPRQRLAGPALHAGSAGPRPSLDPRPD